MVKELDKIFKDISEVFKIEKDLILRKYPKIEDKIYKYTVFKILKNKGYSTDKIANEFYSNKKSNRHNCSNQAVINGIKQLDKVINLEGNKLIKEFIQKQSKIN